MSDAGAQIKSIQTIEKSCDVIVVGGGMSGCLRRAPVLASY